MIAPRNKTCEHPSEIFFEDRLDFCLWALVGMLAPPAYDINDDEPSVSHEPSELFAILDEHLSKAAKAGRREDIARLDEILYKLYSDLSALHHLLSLVHLHRPRVSVRPIQQAKTISTGKAWRYTQAGYLNYDHKRIAPIGIKKNNPNKVHHHTIGYSLGKFLETPKPTGSRANQKWLDQDEAQRAACSQFWAQMRNRQRQILEDLGIRSDDIEADLKILSADLDPKHISSIQTQRAEILARIATKNSQKTTQSIPLKCDIQTQWGSDTQDSTPLQEPKVKIKTRSDKPVNEPDLELKDLTLLDQDNEPRQEKIAVSKRTLEILQSLYPKSNFEERTKSVDWASFVHAMAEVGFIARQTHGSEYSFEPIETCKWYGRGKIVFHKPHPEPKYEAWRLLGIGKRMGKWFGWNAHSFELLEAKSVAERE